MAADALREATAKAHSKLEIAVRENAVLKSTLVSLKKQMKHGVDTNTAYATGIIKTSPRQEHAGFVGSSPIRQRFTKGDDTYRKYVNNNKLYNNNNNKPLHTLDFGDERLKTVVDQGFDNDNSSQHDDSTLGEQLTIPASEARTR